MANLNDPLWDDDRHGEGFTRRRARIGRQLGAERLGLSMFEVEPGQAAYPYHYHLGEEELLVILEGRLVNRGGETVRFLAISTSGMPDVVLYPDSGKLGAFERRPEGGGLYELYRRSDAVDYLDGEKPPG
jgi:uncharacterized cupin superfamily protein